MSAPPKADSVSSPSTPRTDEHLARLAAVDCPAFGHRRHTREGAADGATPLVLARGEGDVLVDVDGRRFVDLAAGFGAAVLGHGHPVILEAIEGQSRRLVQGLGDVFSSDTKINLLEQLAALHPGEHPKVLLGQSGGDAVTAALKTAVLSTGRPGVLAFDGAYHGLGYGPLPACGFRASFREPFAAQLSRAVRFAPYPGLRGASEEASLAFAAEVLERDEIGAVLVEPLLGRGGCVVPPPSFLPALAELARRHGALLVADEIWTGVGRAGAWVRSVADGVTPDILCLGKALGGGLPISACIAPTAIMEGWTRHGEVVHTSTHAGAPLACAAALATLTELRDGDHIARAAALGDELRAKLVVELETLGDVARDVRGRGMMIGLELRDAATAQRLVAGLLDRGYLAITGGVDGATLTLTPALTIARAHLLGLVDAVREILAA
ncbi:MAG: aspartate aminotransferase family protein [Polyangiaceae bacterium]